MNRLIRTFMILFLMAASSSAMAQTDVATAAAARALGDGAQVRITGQLIVVSGTNALNAGRNQFVAVDLDNGAGIFVDDSGGFISATYSAGDIISGLTGTFGTFNGLLQLVPDTQQPTLVSSGNPLPAPNIITATDGASEFEALESTLIRLNLVDIDTADTTFDQDQNYTLVPTNGEALTLMRVFDGLVGEPLPAGLVDIVGVMGQFDGSPSADTGYQIQPRTASDVIDNNPDDPNIEAPTSLAFGQVAPGNSLSLNVEITNTTGTTNALNISNTTSIVSGDTDKFSIVTDISSGLVAAADGGTASISISFAPGNEQGSFSAILRIVSDDSTDTEVDVLLTGNSNVGIDFDTILEQSDFTGLSGDTDAQPDGVAISPDDSIIYTFDSTGTVDGLVKFESNTLSNVASEADIEALNGGSGASQHDLAMGSDGTLYFAGRTGGQTFGTFAIAIPGGDFSQARVMTSGEPAQGLNRLVVDEANNRLLVGYFTAFSNNGQIAFLPLDADGATPTDLVSAEDLFNALPDPDGETEIDMTDFTVQSDGTIIYAHGFSSDNNGGGTLLRITSTGLISVFATPAELILAAGGDPATTNIGNVHLTTMSDDRVVAFVPFVSDGATIEPFIAISSPNGSNWKVVATESSIEADPDVPDTGDIMSIDGGGLTVDSQDNVYWSVQSGDSIDHIILMGGARQSVNSVDNWTIFE